MERHQLLQQYLLDMIKEKQEEMKGKKEPAMMQFTQVQQQVLKDMRIALNKLFVEQKIAVHDSVSCKLIEVL